MNDRRKKFRRLQTGFETSVNHKPLFPLDPLGIQDTMTNATALRSRVAVSEVNQTIARLDDRGVIEPEPFSVDGFNLPFDAPGFSFVVRKQSRQPVATNFQIITNHKPTTVRQRDDL